MQIYKEKIVFIVFLLAILLAAWCGNVFLSKNSDADCYTNFLDKDLSFGKNNWWSSLSYEKNGAGAVFVLPTKENRVQIFRYDGYFLGEYANVGSKMAFSADGAHVAFKAQRDDGQWTVVVDGVASLPFAVIDTLEMSQDGAHVAYRVQKKNGAWSVVYDRAAAAEDAVRAGLVAFIDNRLFYSTQQSLSSGIYFDGKRIADGWIGDISWVASKKAESILSYYETPDGRKAAISVFTQKGTPSQVRTFADFDAVTYLGTDEKNAVYFVGEKNDSLFFSYGDSITPIRYATVTNVYVHGGVAVVEVRQGDNIFLVSGEEKLGPFAYVRDAAFSPQKGFVFSVKKKDGKEYVINGSAERGGFFKVEDIYFYNDTLYSIIADGDRTTTVFRGDTEIFRGPIQSMLFDTEKLDIIALILRNNEGYRVFDVVRGTKGDLLTQEPDDFQLNGKSFLYRGMRGGEQTTYYNNVPALKKQFIFNARFDVRGNIVAHAAENGAFCKRTIITAAVKEGGSL